MVGGIVTTTANRPLNRILDTMERLVRQAIQETDTCLATARSAFLQVRLHVPRPIYDTWGLPAVETMAHRLQCQRMFWKGQEESDTRLCVAPLLSVESNLAIRWQDIRSQLDAIASPWERICLYDARVGYEHDALEMVGFDTKHPREGSLRDIRWYGGAAFEPGERDEVWAGWPAAWLFVPQLELHLGSEMVVVQRNVLVGCGEETTRSEMDLKSHFQQAGLTESPSEVTRATQVGMALPRSDSDAKRYGQAVEQTALDIRDGRYNKLVLARRVEGCRHQALDIGEALSYLQVVYPSSFAFAVGRGSACFLGASPEQLAAVSKGQGRIDCLAGTTGRSEDPAVDTALGNELMQSSKNRAEHEVVRGWITAAISPCVHDVHASRTPTLKKLANVQHLFTPIRCEMNEGAGILDLVEALHPTPAVAGSPRHVVTPLIRSREAVDRGWYAGVAGWLDASGDGEFAVGIRSALVQGSTAWMYAGAGIMGDSNPQSEWEETELKLRPMKRALKLDASTSPSVSEVNTDTSPDAAMAKEEGAE